MRSSFLQLISSFESYPILITKYVFSVFSAVGSTKSTGTSIITHCSQINHVSKHAFVFLFTHYTTNVHNSCGLCSE